MRQIPLATPFGRLAHERGGARGVILSAAVHLSLVLLVVWSGRQLMVADRMPGAGPGKGGGGGGGGARALLLFTPPPPAAAGPALPLPPPLILKQQEPVPLPEIKPPEVAPPEVSAAQLLSALGAGAGPGKGTGTGPGAGSGTGGGTGSGVGPGMGPDSGGGGGKLYPPSPRQIILPPSDRPAAVRGTTITVRFEISSRGDVMRVSLSPIPRDRSFADQFVERLRRYTFTPAYTLDGRPVAAVYEIRITL
jgi:protein TonB